MLRVFILAVVLVAVVAAHTEYVLASPAMGDSTNLQRATSIVVNRTLEPVLMRLLAASATFRNQCQRIANAHGVRVVVQPVFRRFDGANASTTISRSTSGLLLATVEVLSPLRDTEFAELLAHEFEHVLEQIEGVDLQGRAERGGEGVARLASGSYETDRARRAGRAAALEVEAALTAKGD